MTNTTTKVSAFARGYIDCALWCGLSEDDLDGGDPALLELSDMTRAALIADADVFAEANRDDLDLANAHEFGRNDEHLGHDFWLTRNRHGAGFWDRGLGEVGARLTRAAHAEGECNLYVGGDGLVYHQ